MGKRSKFDRVPRDFYPTPEAAVLPLLPHLAPHTKFSEPCCGDGALVRALEKHGHLCYWSSDIEDRSVPRTVSGVWVTSKAVVADALALTNPLKQADCIITNTPYRKDILFPMIEHFSALTPTWLLLNADFMHNVGSVPFLNYCRNIVSIGRVKWIPGSKNGGMENFCWYLFDQSIDGYCRPATEFFGRRL